MQLVDLDTRLRVAASRLGPFGGNVRQYREVTSTNDVAAELAEHGSPHGTVVVAETQTAGRGRHGHRWFSPVGSGLYVSILLRSGVPPLLTLAAGVAVADALRRVSGLEAALEWPNDVVVVVDGRHRKIAGILTEATFHQGMVGRVIVGIGVNLGNVTWPADLAEVAGSVEGVTGRSVDPVSLLVELLSGLARQCSKIESGASAAVLANWEALALSSRGTIVEWSVGAVRRRGISEGIDEQGALMVRVGTRLERLTGGAVRHVR